MVTERFGTKPYSWHHPLYSPREVFYSLYEGVFLSSLSERVPHERYLLGFLFSFYGSTPLLSRRLNLALGFYAPSHVPFDEIAIAVSKLAL